MVGPQPAVVVGAVLAEQTSPKPAATSSRRQRGTLARSGLINIKRDDALLDGTLPLDSRCSRLMRRWRQSAASCSNTSGKVGRGRRGQWRHLRPHRG